MVAKRRKLSQKSWFFVQTWKHSRPHIVRAKTQSIHVTSLFMIAAGSSVASSPFTRSLTLSTQTWYFNMVSNKTSHRHRHNDIGHASACRKQNIWNDATTRHGRWRRARHEITNRRQPRVLLAASNLAFSIWAKELDKPHDWKTTTTGAAISTITRRNDWRGTNCFVSLLDAVLD